MRSRETSEPVVDLLHVPTLLELSNDREMCEIVGRAVQTGTPNRFRLTDKGHAHLGEIMRENGRRLAAAEAQRPPIVTMPPVAREERVDRDTLDAVR